MKALAACFADKQMRIIDAPAPAAPTGRQVMLRMLEVGICGTDKDIATFEYGQPPPGEDRLIIGHESLAMVEAVGSEVNGLQKGDLAVTMVRRPCDELGCVACRHGRADFCYSGQYTERGIKGRDGFLCERVLDEDRYVCKVPHELRDLAVLTEPLTIAEKALDEALSVQGRLPWGLPGQGKPTYKHKALVLGAGPVGQLGAMLLAAKGFAVFMHSRGPATDAKAELAESIGVKYFSGQDHKIEELPGLIGNIDLVYEATGVSPLAFEALEILGVNAVFIFTGVPGRRATANLPSDRIMRQLVLNNQVFFGTVNAARQHYERAIADLERFAGLFKPATERLITGRYKMEQFGDLLSGKAGGIKNTILLEE